MPCGEEWKPEVRNGRGAGRGAKARFQEMLAAYQAGMAAAHAGSAKRA